MTPVWHSRLYGTCLLSGALVFGIAGLRHPILSGDGAVQLATISRTGAWRAIHWGLLFGLPLMLMGLAALGSRHRDTPGEAAARTAVVVATLGVAVWSINILFMAGAAWQLARTYAVADPGLTATHVVMLYDMMHPFGLVAERIATFTMGLAFGVLGWAMRMGRVFPAWLAWSALAVGAAGIVIALACAETSVVLFYGQGALVTWMAAAGAAMLLERRAVG
jgi:hypothetical protein